MSESAQDSDDRLLSLPKLLPNILTTIGLCAGLTGMKFAMEAEWEKAARGVDGRRFPWGNDWDPTRANNGDQLMPIMSFPGGASPFGCFDMAGNAAEWVDGW